MRVQKIVAVVLLVHGMTGRAQQTMPAKRAFRPADWYKVTTLSTPALAPDGAKIAFTVTTVREAENKRHSEVWVVPTQGGEPVRYTSPAFESSDPRFSSDGTTLYFTSQRPGGRGTTWALRMDQPSGEAFQPDGQPRIQSGSLPSDRSFAIVTQGQGGGRGGRGGGAPSDSSSDTAATNDPFGRMQPMARPPYNAITKPENAARFDGRQIIDMTYKGNGRGYLPGPRMAPRTDTLKPAQLYIERPGQPRKPLTKTNYSHRDAVVSPDGKWVAFVADAKLRSDSTVNAERDSVNKLQPDRKRDERPRNDTEIFVLPVAACEAQTTECNPRALEYAGNESQLAWSPDSRRIAFVGQPGRFKNQRLFVVSAAGGKPQDVLGSWQYEPGQIRWLANGQLAMVTSTGGNSGLYTIDPDSKKVTTVLSGRRQISGVTFDAAERTVVYVSTDLTHPTELYVATIGGACAGATNGAQGGCERKLTSFNDKLNTEVAWADAERFMVKSVGGLDIESWLMKP
ncbi:MAG: TolB family protein, partial [Gemmatimonas sp.]